MKKTWIQKLEANDLPKVVELDENGQKKFNGAKTMLVPSPKDVYDIMQNVPYGRIITVAEIRVILSKKFGTDTTCPLTSGIFIWIAANASVEIAEKEAKKPNMPFWRTTKSKGELVEKYPGGIENQKEMLENEGIKVIQKGKKTFIENFELYVENIV
ncbi:MAG: MGMT family protein [Bacteroidales bacterium]|nr:MGMT family protein [Bacteroidales bacterium]